MTDDAKKDYEHTTLTLPRDYYDLLQKLALEKRVPVSRLIWWALDNELDCTNPFDYPCPPPTTTFVEYAYTAEAQKMHDFLIKYPEGVTVDMLVVMRRQIGIPNKATVLLALRELLATSLAYQSNQAPKGTFFKKFGTNHTWIRLTNETLENIARNRKLLEEKKAKIEKKESSLDYKESLLKPPTKEWK